MSDPLGLAGSIDPNQSNLGNDVTGSLAFGSPGTIGYDGTYIVVTSSYRTGQLNIPSDGLLDAGSGYDFTSSDFNGTCATFGGGASCGQLGLNTVANQAMIGMVGIPAVGVAAGGAVASAAAADVGASAIADQGFFSGSQYTPKVVQQMGNAADLYHAFPTLIDGEAAATGQVTNMTNSTGFQTLVKLEAEGSVNGTSGAFEYIKDLSGNINHRLFVPF